MFNTLILSSPIGELSIVCNATHVIQLDILTPQPYQENFHIPRLHPLTELQQEILNEIYAYFDDPNHRFSLPIEATGTAYQKDVWAALTHIPSGTTLTYAELAKQLNSHPRAIGQACKKNPLPIIIPCHRITASDGLGGFAGKTHGAYPQLKQSLLELENTASQSV